MGQRHVHKTTVILPEALLTAVSQAGESLWWLNEGKQRYLAAFAPWV